MAKWIEIISAPSFSTSFICPVTTCLWVLQQKHHSQFGNVLSWHFPKAPHLPGSIISHFCAKPSEFFIFHSCVAPKASCYILDFILPLTLCSVWLRQHPDGLFLKWACSGKNLTIVTHQRTKLTWKDCAQHKRLFFFHWHLGVTQLCTAHMCVHMGTLCTYGDSHTHSHTHKLTLQRYQLSACYCLPLFWASRSCFQTMSSNLKYTEYF